MFSAEVKYRNRFVITGAATSKKAKRNCTRHFVGNNRTTLNFITPTPDLHYQQLLTQISFDLGLDYARKKAVLAILELIAFCF